MNKIYVFSNTTDGRDGLCLALAEDGVVLGSHWCSHEGYASLDLGVVEGSRTDRHEAYAKHYPEGYEMEFVRAKDVLSHEGISKAYKLNQELKDES